LINLFYKVSRFLPVLFIILICHESILGQNKIVLTKGSKHHKIKRGQLLGVTRKGESYKFEGWKNLDKNDMEIRENFWAVDSIGSNSIKLVTYRYNVTYRLDTVSGKKKNINKGNDYILQEVLKSQIGKDGYYKVVYKIPTVEVLIYKSRIIPFDSIESFTDLKMNFAKSITHMDRIHFKYPSGNNSSGYKNTAGALLILAVVSGVIIETTFNATVTIIEKLDMKKEFLTERYKTSEWKIEVK
jgi:hypothetical protein